MKTKKKTKGGKITKKLGNTSRWPISVYTIFPTSKAGPQKQVLKYMPGTGNNIFNAGTSSLDDCQIHAKPPCHDPELKNKVRQGENKL